MYIYHMYMTFKSGILAFEWDEGNTDKSYHKHGISPKEAEEVFVDEDSFVFPDVKHSQNEPRYIMLGRTFEGKKLFVVFAIRKEKIRIISARRMHGKEVQKYENAQKNPSL